MRLAIIGPFDIENYGDHIFRQVLQHHIKSKFPDSKIDVFSVFAGPMGFGEKASRVISIDKLEKRHIKKPYDAIIIAGGSVIHFESLTQKLRGKQVTYPMWKLWAIASLVSAKYGVRLLWNNPEAPLDFEGWEIPVVRNLVRPVDFLSVRNISSRKALRMATDKEIIVGPATAWLLREVYTDDIIAKSLPPEVGTHRKLLLFHCNQRIAKEDLPALVTILLKFQREGYAVVLLPLAYTNSEEDSMRAIQQLANNQLLYIDRTLSLTETVALFSRCRVYIGLSFHGAITATLFGSEIIAFDYEKRRKTKELYKLINKDKYYVTDIKKLGRVSEKLIKRQVRKTKIRKSQTQTAIIENLKDDVRMHFKALETALQHPHQGEKMDLSEEYFIAATEIDKRLKTRQEIRDLSDSYQQCYDQYQALRDTIKAPRSS